MRLAKLLSGQFSIINQLAFRKPWLYLVVSCYFLSMILVFAGNPTLPIDALATHGWSWHHLPEVSSFLFLGMYLGSLGYLSSESFTYHDSFALFLLAVVGLGYAQIISYIRMFPVVLTIVFIPSFLGYFVIRFHNIQKFKKPN